MGLNTIATVILIGFMLQWLVYTRKTWLDGYAPGWVIVMALMGLTLIVPIWAVWV